jgi:hypothetical protein
MAHEEVKEENLSHEEIQYRYYVQRGLDFIRIELFRSAREHYKQALNYKPGDPFVLERIDACNAQIRKDRTKVLILVPLVLGLIAFVVAMNV